MSRRLDITLIVLTADRILRADYMRRGQPEPIVQSSLRQGQDSATNAIATALALVPAKPGRRVYVLDDSLPSISLTLPLAQTTGLAPDELAAALAFEAEAFTSLPPANVLLAWHQTGTHQGLAEFQVVQCLRQEMDEIRSVLQRAGCRLAGLSHPAALSTPDVGQVPTTVAADSEALIARWLEALAGGSVGTLPLILPPRRTSSVEAHRIFGGIVFAVAVAGVLIHWLVLSGRTSQMEIVLDQRRDEARQVSQLENRVNTLRKELSAAKDARAEYEKNFDILKARRQSIANLLRVMAGSSKDNVVVRRLRTDNEGRTVLLGTAWDSGATDAFAARLEKELDGTGWIITPQQRQAQGLLPDSGPWAFALRLNWEDDWTETLPAAQNWEEEIW